MTVAKLIKLLKTCPQDMEIMLYYDGSPQLEPNMAFMGSQYPDKPERVILAEEQDVYNLPDFKYQAGPAQVLFSPN